MTNIITNYLKKGREKKKRPRADYFYASDGYLPNVPKDSRCGRNLGYQFLGYDSEDREDMAPIFAHGDLFHNHIQSIFVKEKLATGIEDFSIVYDDDGGFHYIRKNSNKVVITEPAIVHGRKDITFMIDGMKFVSDIKSINHGAWQFLGNAPKEPHYAQVQFYLHHHREDKDIKGGFILYICKCGCKRCIEKADGHFKEFMIEYDEKYVMDLLVQYKELREFIDKKGLPPRIFASGTEPPWQCHYCGFTKICLSLSLDELDKTRFVNYPKEEDNEKS